MGRSNNSKLVKEEECEEGFFSGKIIGLIPESWAGETKD